MPHPRYCEGGDRRLILHESESPRRVTASLNILAFDLDNTLLDPGSTLYAELHRTFVSGLTKEVSVEALLEEFERVRSCGDALERLGLANPIHDRGHPQSLAAFVLTVPWTVFDSESTSLSSTKRQAFRRTLDRLRMLHDATTQGAPEERLDAEFFLRDVLRSARDPRGLRDAITSLAEESSVCEHARRYAALEADQRHYDHLPLLRNLADRGVTTVVVSQGRVDVQTAKLRRLKLAEFFDRRLLVTESASRIVGRDELDHRIDEELARCSHGPAPDGELLSLWRFRCILDRWGRKSPEYYARCLHAIANAPSDCQRTLADLRHFPFDAWKQDDVRFVMVGDRLDTDIDPVLANLGRAQCETIHLRSGKYADIAHPNTALDRAPHRTFTRWSEVEHYLLNDLDWTRVNPIRTPPAMLRAADFDDELLRFGLRSTLPIVRSLSELAMRTIR